MINDRLASMDCVIAIEATMDERQPNRGNRAGPSGKSR